MKDKKWTLFWDMHSGGSQKEDWSLIFIEAPEDVAKIVFYNRFGHNPDRVTCTCCGEDYSIDEYETLEQASGFHRGCKYVYMKNGRVIPDEEGWIMGRGNAPGVWSGYIEEPGDNIFKDYQSLEKFIKNKDVLVIYSKDIKPKEKKGDLPIQGYVWND